MKGRQCFDALDIRCLLEKGAFRTVGVENNHTGSPRVNPSRLRVAIKGTPTFPMGGIVQGVPSMGISWLVFKGVLAIVSNNKTKSEVDRKPIVQRIHHYKIPKYQTIQINMPSKGKYGMMRAQN